ncbi:3-oxoadipate enol-lactonase [Kaistella treverensis]|uniref:3-oxoadipate enol-lactonase n=1 Tax=Kaistella treverensis TaxID=631455 RepID=A0A1I3K5N2_9FLAO|nr:3-oxoadipate enol-lactonase [Kaistella treverensis]SFI67618.1 3-oxoadipate enol-lactonase [Kaistella treverensis]
MPKITVNKAVLNYKFLDNGKAETLVFSNSLGTNYSMWAKQENELSKHFNLLFSDTRGHGESETTDGDYSAELLGNDILELTEILGFKSFIFCGLSMGGLVGQWLALNGGSRVEKLILCNTSPKIGTKESWNERISIVKTKGLKPVGENTAEKWFTDDFIKNEPEEVQQILENFKKNSAQGYSSCCAMVRDADFSEEIKNIEKPVLIISGSEDPVTTVDDGNKMQKLIKNSQHIILNARHLSAFECPKEFNDALLNFLK